jgi:Flp pilus assembly protein TadD
VQFYQLEGNWYLGAGQPREAVPYLEELVRLQPDVWSFHASLGAAYLRSRRYADAVNALERAMPGWLTFPERRVDVVPNDLATAYLAQGRVRDAASVLRRIGLNEPEIEKRMSQLQARVPRR